MSVITARYPGECFSCGTHIDRGERVRWTRGEGIRHAQSRDCEDPAGTSCCGDYHYADCPTRGGSYADAGGDRWNEELEWDYR